MQQVVHNVSCECRYVTQDDVMLGTQTVREYLLWQARMRLPSSFGPRHRHARVNNLLRELQLEHVASSKIGDSFVRGLSGGEKRRVRYVCGCWVWCI